MRIRVTMKDPDTLYDCISEAVRDELQSVADEDERAALLTIRVEKAQKVASKWFQYGEYLSVEIDTDAETIVVLPVSR